VFAALVIQHAMFMRRMILSRADFSSFTTFSHIISQTARLKKLLNMKCVV